MLFSKSEDKLPDEVTCLIFDLFSYFLLISFSKSLPFTLIGKSISIVLHLSSLNVLIPLLTIFYLIISLELLLLSLFICNLDSYIDYSEEVWLLFWRENWESFFLLLILFSGMSWLLISFKLESFPPSYGLNYTLFCFDICNTILTIKLIMSVFLIFLK